MTYVPEPDIRSADRPIPIRPVPASVVPLREVRCALCGAPLVRVAERFQVVSPLVADGGRAVTVCRTCLRATVSEGYMPSRRPA